MTYRNHILSLLLVLLAFQPATWSQPNIACDSIAALNALTDSYLFQKDYRDALKVALRAQALTSKNECSQLMCETHLRLAKAYNANGDNENAIRSYLNAIAWAEKLQQHSKLPPIYIEIGNVYAGLQAYEKAKEYFSRALKSIDLEPHSINHVYSLEGLAYSYLKTGQTDKAIEAYSLLDTIATAINLHNTRARALYYLSVLFGSSGNTESSIATYRKLYSLFENRNDTLGMIITLNNISHVQIKAKLHSGSVVNLEKAIDLATNFAVPYRLLAGLYVNLGINYQNIRDNQRAITYLGTALDIYKRNSDHKNSALTLNSLANLYLLRGDLHNASQHALQAIDFAKRSGEKATLSTCYETYSKILKEGNDFTNALSYYEKHLAIRDSMLLLENMEQQKRTQTLSNLEKAEKEQQLYIADEEMKDLLLKQLRLEMETKRQEVELLKQQSELEHLEKEKKYQQLLIAKKENESQLQRALIQNLEQENSINALRIQQKEAEEKERLREIELLQSEAKRKELELEKEAETRKRIIWMLVLSFLALAMMIVGLIAVFKRNRLLAEQKKIIESKNESLERANTEITEKNVQLSEMAEEVRAQNEEITFQKELIEEKNKSITDSIQYASIIQNAVISDESVLASHFADHFVLMMPRDIVSGDFWWCARKGERTILAVADCTGHGVPGAMLSILGISLINEITAHNPEIAANELLQHLRKMIIESLSNTTGKETPRDGMDISVCIFDYSTRRVEIALANHKICIKANNGFEVVKGDNAPIGFGFGIDKEFSIQYRPLVKGTKYFLFSDGYADQFGGDRGKKMNHKMFRELLASSSNHGMAKQKEILTEEFNKWKGKCDQVDDVTVLGVEV